MTERLIILEDCQATDEHGEPYELDVVLRSISCQDSIIVLIKTHDVSYHLSLNRKAVGSLKSIEFSGDYWFREKKGAGGKVLVARIRPSTFMRQAIDMLLDQCVPLWGVFLWTDIIVDAFHPLDLHQEWVLICHQGQLIVCHDGHICFSRATQRPLANDLTALTRYLKRFGYEDGSSLSILSSRPCEENFPNFVRTETQTIKDWSYKINRVKIPHLLPLQRLYAWPKRIRWGVNLLSGLSLLGLFYVGWEYRMVSKANANLQFQIQQLPKKEPIEKDITIFKNYCHLKDSKMQGDLTQMIHILSSAFDGKVIATQLEYQVKPFRLCLHLAFRKSTNLDHTLATLQEKFPNNRVDIQMDSQSTPPQGVKFDSPQETSLGGILTID